MKTKLRIFGTTWTMLLAGILGACKGSPLGSNLSDAGDGDQSGAAYAGGGTAFVGPNVSTIALAGTPSVFISNQEMLNAMLNDLRQLSREQQVFTRYFTLTNLWNAGVDANSMAGYRNAVSKLVNSLSYAPSIAVPVPIDQNQTIFRVDIRAYGWSRGLWEEITARDPYAFFSNTNEESEINARTQVGRRAFVRADWCASVCLQGAIYDIVMQVPNNLFQLEQAFGVDSIRDDGDGNVVRSAFAQSGVSSQYRMMEAHGTQFGTYWKSWDFNPEQGRARRNLFEFPLDPFVAGGDGFDFAAGEMIWQLPNGLSLYMLADNNAKKLEKAVQAVVQDPTREDAAVTNAISCFRCHYKGMIRAKDEMRPHFQLNGFAFGRQELAIIAAEYAEQPQTDALYKAFEDKYAVAVQQLSAGVPYSFGEDGYKESVTMLARQFEAQLPLPMAAAEFGLTPQDFQTLLSRSNLFSRRLGNVLVKESSVKRAVLEDNFAFIIDEFGFGRPFIFQNIQ